MVDIIHIFHTLEWFCQIITQNCEYRSCGLVNAGLGGGDFAKTYAERKFHLIHAIGIGGKKSINSVVMLGRHLLLN